MKTRIEWCDYSINPVKGLCPVACSYCYARRLYKRFKWNPAIQWDEQCLNDLKSIKQPSRIFVGSTENIFWYVNAYPQHTFIFLTKQPQNLIKFSPFPKNCWVGVSTVDKLHFLAACHYMADIKARVKFLSFEPLLESMESSSPIGKHLMNGGINWVIIGQQTPLSAKTMPRGADIRNIIHGANEIPIPVFLKNNLKGFLPFAQYSEPWKDVYNLRQEFPKGLDI